MPHHVKLVALGGKTPLRTRLRWLPTPNLRDAEKHLAARAEFASADRTGRYAVGMRGDQVRHFVADGAVRASLDGRAVVLTLCGHLGWGPMETAPQHWRVCAECAGIVETGP